MTHLLSLAHVWLSHNKCVPEWRWQRLWRQTPATSCPPSPPNTCRPRHRSATRPNVPTPHAAPLLIHTSANRLLKCQIHDLHLTGFWFPASNKHLPTIPVLSAATPLVTSLARPPFTCLQAAFPNLTKILQFLSLPVQQE